MCLVGLKERRERKRKKMRREERESRRSGGENWAKKLEKLSVWKEEGR